MAVSGANRYSVRPSALVSTVTPPMRDGLQAAAGGGRGRAVSHARRKRRAPPGRPRTRPPRMPQPPRRPRYASPEAAAAGLACHQTRQTRQGGEGSHLYHSRDDPGRRPDLREPEQADPQRQQVAAQGGQGEPGAGRRGEPVAGRQHRHTKPEGRDHLEQEQPADRRDRPVAGQVQVKVNRAGRDQQPAPGHPQCEPLCVRARLAAAAPSPRALPAPGRHPAGQYPPPPEPADALWAGAAPLETVTSVPHTAGQVQPVALRLARCGIANVGVERMPVVGGLHRAVRAGDRRRACR